MLTRLWLSGFVVVLLLAPMGSARAAFEDAAASAAVWLEANQNGDGSWGADPETRAFFTSEAVNALRAVGLQNSAYFGGITWLENHEMSSADSQARRIVTLVPHGDDLTHDSDRLEASFSTESFFGDGWGLSGAYGPSSFDTALVLLAWRALGEPAATQSEAISGVNFLLATQTEGSDLGWQGALGIDNAIGDPVTTATVLRAFAAVKGPITGHEIGGDLAASFLQSTVTASSPARQQAHAALALLRWVPGTADADALLSDLEASQAIDGSWNGDVHTTAMALQAFAAKLGTDDPTLQENILIADLGLRATINLALGKNRVDAITRGEMLRLVDLDASGFGIEDLTGIEEAQNLESINLLGNAIADLTPLEVLPNLTTIIIANACDVDGDGAIRAVDAQIILQAIVNNTTLSPAEMAAADVAPPGAPDGILTVADTVPVLRAAAGYSVPACGN